MSTNSDENTKSDKSERLAKAFQNAWLSEDSVGEHRYGEPVDAFSEWHRETMPRFYPFTDIDAFYYDPVRERACLLCERKHVPDGALSLALPRTHPLDDYQRAAYLALSERADVPAYTLWYTDECDEFVVHEIGEPVASVEALESPAAFMDWLDTFRFGGGGSEDSEVGGE